MSELQSNDSFLTVAEVAALLKLNQQTIRNWIDAGTLPAVRVGRRVRIPRTAIQEMLVSGSQGGTGQAQAPAGPSADDFWGGEPVGGAEPDPSFAARAATGSGFGTPDTGAPTTAGAPSPRETSHKHRVEDAGGS